MDKKDTIIMSATRMTMYLTCKWKYWCNYVLRLPRKPNVSFKLGIAVHEALAVAGKIWKKHEQFTSDDIDRIKGMYNKVAAREGIADTNIYYEGQQMVMKRLKNFAQGNILTVEDRFRVSTDEGVMLTGAMDKVEELADNTILVTDYKTSKYYETAAELKSDIQLSVYDIVASIKYPNYDRIILSLDYLRHEPVHTYRTVGERLGFLEYMLAIYKEMQILEKDRALPMLNDMCNWCDFTDNCTMYQDALGGKSFIKKKPEEYNDEELVKDYLEVKSKKRILDGRERQLKDYILAKINSTGEDLVGQDKRIYIRQNPATTYDPKTAYEVIPIEDFLEMVYVSKRAMDSYLDKHPAGKAKIMETAKKRFNAPFLSYKKL
jgi:RecB family exonuclease